MIVLRWACLITGFIMVMAIAAVNMGYRYGGPVIAYGVGGDIFMDDLTHRRTYTLVAHNALDTFPAWSADGEYLAFISSRDTLADYALFVMHIASQETKLIARLDAYRPQPYDPVAAPRWSPTGEHIAVPIGIGITVVNVASGEVNLFRHELPLHHARWAADGRELIFMETGIHRTMTGTVWRFIALDITTGEMRDWGTFDLNCDVMTKPMALSADENRIAYFCKGRIYVYDRRSAMVQPLAVAVDFPDGLNWSPDDDSLVFTDFFVRDDNGFRAGVITIHTERGKLRYGLPHPADKPVWMPLHKH